MQKDLAWRVVPGGMRKQRGNDEMKAIRKMIVLLVTAAILAAAFAGCDTQTKDQSNEGTDARADWPDKLVFAAIPTEDQTIISRRYADFIEYLEDRLDLEIEIYFPTSYTATIEALGSGRVDIARLGPFAYILATERTDAEVFAVTTDRGTDPTYYSAFITLEGSGIDELADLEGKRVAFADPASTSGHLFPRAMIVNELGIPNDDIEDFFGETSFSGGHQASAVAVLNGDVDAAPISSGGGFRSLEGPLKDHPNTDKVKVFARTGDIPTTGYTLRGGLPEDLKAQIRGAFYDAVNYPDLLEDFLNDVGTAGYIHAFDSDYDIIRDTARAIEMSPEELF
jgi:phosphonate transport system substrate-binding protein